MSGSNSGPGIVERPSGVITLQGLEGIITLTSSDGFIHIAVNGQNIDLTQGSITPPTPGAAVMNFADEGIVWYGRANRLQIFG